MCGRRAVWLAWVDTMTPARRPVVPARLCMAAAGAIRRRPRTLLQIYRQVLDAIYQCLLPCYQRRVGICHCRPFRRRWMTRRGPRLRSLTSRKFGCRCCSAPSSRDGVRSTGALCPDVATADGILLESFRSSPFGLCPSCGSGCRWRGVPLSCPSSLPIPSIQSLFLL